MDSGEPLQFDAVPVPTPPGGPLAVELVPAPAPWDVARRLAHLPHLLFLDSSETHPDRGRYSYVSADTSLEMHLSPRNGRTKNKNSLWAIHEHLPARLAVTLPELPPFQGGLAGIFGYEFGRALETLPQTFHDEFCAPEWAFSVSDWVISFDHEQSQAWLISTGRSIFGAGPDRERAENRLDQVLAALRRPIESLQPLSELAFPRPRHVRAAELAPQYPLPGFPGVTSNFDRAGYEAAVRRVVEYIHAGDAFQVNLSQRLLAPLTEHPLELYGRLRTLNPAPFSAYFDLGDFQILSASPERFLRVHPGGEVETRPIKGTRPRGRTPEEDAALIRDLVTNPKDRAENVMIVDLLRNDIGKACEYGSVRVPRVCEVETFRFVHHLVSEVRGKLKPGVGPLELLAGAFPGGSVTGAPKVRAMEIIAELEPTARGPYCGCLGWIGFDGAMDTNILIRTFTAGRGWVQFPVGGGIVADSDPAREYEETLHKAAGLLRALKAEDRGQRTEDSKRPAE
ncbi:para-aminobenzoate synthase : Para-aminobenzoate synthase component I OS=Planctomyces maris DSM 8797 GN=PM8797T_00312 PE=4 SV=1: Anth_synt_I_N: Chorismate_bind [Gemmataceae bacterium]|nr:para-aminobenzoate synthase : Para-aminobenzoate synthase component I OS=Planctomyces maris DSM 8797 GN=PM8797T_00312 PE=4 SV=1: Anth_synt_I_N: Chorismate_bind [Gemmataceae bacterium]VTT97210.1 para-aminobenzoate synthase : Para-aminobenzoate synthase component I OS=Planctomyces maris DSM 8797 GN=PM8797T_00312 PE=4 SV=1: Anth_synt_I_N: Chorismate_bind [Gemmataceae bacterium]